MLNVSVCLLIDRNCVSVSYEERLKSLVLKEEFFPLMDEIRKFVATLTSAGKGICL